MQPDLDSGDIGSKRCKVTDKRLGRFHWPDRVRTRWAYTNFEDIEYANRCHQSEPSVSRLALPPTAEMLLLTVYSLPNRCT